MPHFQHGEMPYELQYQSPNDPPSATTPFNHFTPVDSTYIPIFYCQMLWRELTNSYLACRKNGSFQEDAIQVLYFCSLFVTVLYANVRSLIF